MWNSVGLRKVSTPYLPHPYKPCPHLAGACRGSHCPILLCCPESRDCEFIYVYTAVPPDNSSQQNARHSPNVVIVHLSLAQMATSRLWCHAAFTWDRKGNWALDWNLDDRVCVQRTGLVRHDDDRFGAVVGCLDWQAPTNPAPGKSTWSCPTGTRTSPLP